MPKRVYLESSVKCSCGHALSLHAIFDARPCRVRDCECEGFWKIKKDGTVIRVDPQKRKTGGAK